MSESMRYLTVKMLESVKDMELLYKVMQHDEGRRSYPYQDSVGKLTIGIGRNLDDVGLFPDEINFLFENDVARFVSFLREIFPHWDSMKPVRQVALISWAFQGEGSCLTFKKMIEAVKAEDWREAALQLLDSKYAKQVGPRANRLAKMLEEG